MACEVKEAISPDEDPTQRLKRMLEKQGIEWWHDDEVSKDHVDWMTDDAVFTSLGMDGDMLAVKVISKMTPEQAIAATVGRRDTMELWPEWEQVLFANVTDEMAQDNLNECVHELLEKAAKVGAGTCQGEIDSDYFECKLTTFKCHSCGWSGVVDDCYAGYSFEDTDMPRHCPNCGMCCIG